MSLANLQGCIAALIRIPEHRPAWLQEQLRAELTPAERAAVLSLAEHAELKKYGEEQAAQRWDSFGHRLDRLGLLLGDERLYRLWQEGFEPGHMTVPSDMTFDTGTYTLAFLDFLATAVPAEDPAAVPPGFLSLLAFETAEAALSQLVPVPLPLAAGSCLAHGNFRMLTLDYDVTAWLAAMAESVPVPAMEERCHSLVLVRRGEHQAPRIFEIDAPMQRFLAGQTGPAVAALPAAAMRRDLAVMGLA